MFFKIPEVDAKYKNTAGNADPVVSVVLNYNGKLSGIPLPLADKLFADGAHIALKEKEKPAAPVISGNKTVDTAKSNGIAEKKEQAS